MWFYGKLRTTNFGNDMGVILAPAIATIARPLAPLASLFEGETGGELDIGIAGTVGGHAI